MSPVEIIPRIRDSHERVLQKRRKNEAAEELQFPAVSLDDLFRAVARHFFLSFFRVWSYCIVSRVLCYIFERIFQFENCRHIFTSLITRAENIFEEARPPKTTTVNREKDDDDDDDDARSVDALATTTTTEE